MADLTAANVAVELPVVVDRSMDKYLRTFPKITFGNGVLTYPANGIPLPDKGKFGLNFECLRAYVNEADPNGYKYVIDKTNWKLQIFGVPALDGNAAAAQALAELGSVAVAATVLELELVGR